MPDPALLAASVALGLDAGGTQTRWAAASVPDGAIVAEGSARPFSGWQMAQPGGRQELLGLLREVTAALDAAASRKVPVRGLCAGITGFDGDGSDAIFAVVSEALGLPGAAIVLFNDIELACRAAFAPGDGYLVYAGTGSVAAYVDASGALHRAGGRGGLIDDGGSGYWIAREALRRVWRAEDECPGAWRESGLARAVFDAVGSSDWSATRAFVYGASRGQMGELALAVARAANERDAEALAILRAVGDELARLARALIDRCGPRPVRLAGRAFALHPSIEAAVRERLPASSIASPSEMAAHRSAAAIALRLAS